MKLIKMVVLSLFIGVKMASAAVTVDIDDAVKTDADVLGKWFSERVAHITAFNASAAPVGPGEVHSLLGVEFGLSLGYSSSKIDTDELHSLPTTELDPGVFDVASQIPLAVPLVHAKVGLPFDLDLGLKYGRTDYGFDQNNVHSEIKNTVFGVEVRRRLMGEGVTGVVLPDVALSLAYDQSSGDVFRSERYSGPIGGGDTLVADTKFTSEWKTSAVTARVVGSKQFLILTPYFGGGYSRLMGDADTTMTVIGGSTSDSDVNVRSTSSGKADDDVLHLLGGVEFTFFPMLKFNLGGLYAKDDWGATAGLRFTFR